MSSRRDQYKWRLSVQIQEPTRRSPQNAVSQRTAPPQECRLMYRKAGERARKVSVRENGIGKEHKKESNHKRHKKHIEVSCAFCASCGYFPSRFLPRRAFFVVLTCVTSTRVAILAPLSSRHITVTSDPSLPAKLRIALLLAFAAFAGAFACG